MSEPAFPADVRFDYRTVVTRYGGPDHEVTIPLGRWRRGDGLAGSRGHVYRYGDGWAGIWLIRGRVRQALRDLAVEFPSLVVQQVGTGEATARVPMSDLPRLLPILRAKRRRHLSPAQLEAAQKGQRASPVAKPSGIARCQKPPAAPGSTIVEKTSNDTPESKHGT